MKQYKPQRKTGLKQFQNKNNKRATRQDRGYDGEWYSYRTRFIKANPKCYICGAPTTVIDHVLRARDNMEYFKVPENHISNCASCHGSITQKFDKHKVQDLKGKLAYIEKMREFNRCKVKVKIIRYSKN